MKKRCAEDVGTGDCDCETKILALEAVLSRIAEWSCTYGSELKPKGTDTYGEGVREMKRQVQQMLKELKDVP